MLVEPICEMNAKVSPCMQRGVGECWAAVAYCAKKRSQSQYATFKANVGFIRITRVCSHDMMFYRASSQHGKPENLSLTHRALDYFATISCPPCEVYNNNHRLFATTRESGRRSRNLSPAQDPVNDTNNMVGVPVGAGKKNFEWQLTVFLCVV